jgi:hypothetical protein
MRRVDPARLFDELLGIAARAGLEVRTRTFRDKVSGKVPFAGGLCTVIGKPMVLLNANASPVERSVALADALASQALSEVEMTAGARRFITERARSRSGVVEPDSAPKPGLAKTASARKKKPQQQ